MTKKKTTMGRVVVQKEGLIAVAISMLIFGFDCLQSHYPSRDYPGIIFGTVLIVIGFVILVGRGYLKLNMWHPDHIEIVTPKEYKEHKLASKKPDTVVPKDK